MGKEKITIRTGGLEEAAKEFIDIWHQVEQGNAPKTPIEKISFKDQRLLFKTLTPKRFEILEYVHQKGHISIRSLARSLHRDYSNVHQDVKILYRLGLIFKDEKNNKYYVPWDIIVTEIRLPALKSKSSRQPSNQNIRRIAHG